MDVLRSSRKLHRLSASKRFTFSVSKCLRSWCIEYVAPLYPKAWLIFDKFSGNVLRNKSFISITFAVNENTLTLMRYSWYSHYQDICYTHKFGKICSTGRYFKTERKREQCELSLLWLMYWLCFEQLHLFSCPKTEQFLK